MQSWETTIHKMVVEAARGVPIVSLEEYVRLVAWATLRASTLHPEWAQAQALTMPSDAALVNRLAAILVNGTPVERMVV